MSCHVRVAKFELNAKLREKIEKCLDECDLESIDAEFKEKLDFCLDDEKFIEFSDLKKLQALFNEHSTGGTKLYIHELITGSNLYLPKYEPPPRNPELEARVQSLKARFANEEYAKMVKNVDLNSSLRYKNTFNTTAMSTDFRFAQGQLIAILNMVLVVLGSFAFGYKSIEYSLETPNYLWQMTGGFILAVIVAIADLYFLFKKLIKLDDEAVTDGSTKQKANKKIIKQKVN